MRRLKIILAMSVVGCFFSAHADDMGGMSSLQAAALMGGAGGGMGASGMASSMGGASSDSSFVPPIASGGGMSNMSSLSSMSSAGSGDTVANTTPDLSDKEEMRGTKHDKEPAIKPRPPAEPNAFQLSVQIRTGLALKQYGYDLFSLPNTYYPVNNVPIDTNYTLGPGDQIFVQAWGSVSVSYTVKVSSDGTIFIPKVGTFNVAGIKAGSLETYLKSQIGKVYKKFKLSATVSKIRSIQVNIAGYAEVPGTYTVSSLTSLANAVFVSGGPNNNGSLRHVELRRNGITVCDFDMYDVLLKGDNSHDVRLLPGDIIFFEPKGNEVAIYDGVKQSAIYETRDGETINDVLKFAGGASFDNAKTKVVLEHISNDKISVVDYPYQSGLKEMVDNGAIIHFMLMNKVYAKTIVLMGNVANPTRIMFKPGMKVSDVIPKKEALLTKSFWDSYSYNTYGRDHILTQTGLEKTSNRFGDNVASYNASTGLTGGTDKAGTHDNMDLSGNSLRESEYEEHFYKQKANLDNNDVFQNKDNLFIAGPLSIPEADINWNYAVIIRINQSDYSTHVIPFNLAKAIARDPENDIKLQSGDVIDILSSKDLRNPIENYSMFAFIDGEVKYPGVYELKAGDTLVDLIKRAGDLTPKAYLFGMELDRLAVKKKQVKILNQMLDQAQQTLIAQSSVGMLSVATSDQAQVQQGVLKQQQALIDKMRGIKPVGRVVLKLDSNNAKLSDLPNFEMNNGDTVYIPPRPNTVDVIGQVFNPATFAYDRSLDIADYINQAGSENQYADKSNEYILQANGIIYSRAQSGWYGVFAWKKPNPGDTVIVPQEMQFGSTMLNLLNWTQILSNFGMGAASISVFKSN